MVCLSLGEDDDGGEEEADANTDQTKGNRAAGEEGHGRGSRLDDSCCHASIIDQTRPRLKT